MHSKKPVNPCIPIIFLLLFTLTVFAADWSTWMYDNSRSGSTPESVSSGSLRLQWTYISRFEPDPINSGDNENGLILDGCYYPVAAKGKVVFGSSADGKIYCLDAKNGKKIWTYFTEGPVRFAPTIKNEKVLVGGDDGYVYCLNLDDGKLNWKYSHSTNARRIASNGRLSSAYAIRTGLIADDNTVYFGCGMFPSSAKMGARSIGLNISDGSEVQNSKLMFYPQGYLRQNGSKIECPRNRFGYTSLASINMSNAISNFSNTSMSTINVGGIKFSGKEGHVSGGNFTANVEGKALGLIFSDGRLYVRTSKGYIYCFGTNHSIPVTVKPEKIVLPYREKARQDYETAAKEILAVAGLGDNTKGYALIIDCEAGGLAIALAEASELQIVCVDTDNSQVSEANNNIDAAGLSDQITVQNVSSYDDLSYVSHMFNIISFDGYATGGNFSGSKTEVERLLRPYGGVALIGETIKYGNVVGGGQWTHDRANPSNNPNSFDTYVDEDLELQWHGAPYPSNKLIDRHRKTKSPLFCDGILVHGGNDYFWGIDAYNGTILWEKSIDNCARPSAPYKDCSWFAMTADRLYVAQEECLLGLDPRTGEEVMRFGVPYESWEWSYVAYVGDMLYGTAAMSATSGKTWGTSGYIFAMNRLTGAEIWQYDPEAAIVNLSICIGDGKVFFIAAGNSSTQNSSNPGFSMFNDGSSDVVALDMKTGEEVWKKEYDLSDFAQSCYMLYSKNHTALFAVGCTSGDANYRIAGWDADDGSPTWEPTTLATGESRDHWNIEAAPVISGDSLFILSFNYKVSLNVTNGKGQAVYWKDEKGGHGCSNYCATETHLFHRGWNNMIYNIAERKNNRLTTINRPGCNINSLPAGGLLSVPEQSWDCTCSFPTVESYSWRTTKQLVFDDITGNESIGANKGINKTGKLQLSVFRGVNFVSLYIQNTIPSKKLDIRIVNVAGRTLLNKSVTPRDTKYSFRWNFRSMATGLYFISLKTGKEKCTRKLMIVK